MPVGPAAAAGSRPRRRQEILPSGRALVVRPHVLEDDEPAAGAQDTPEFGGSRMRLGHARKHEYGHDGVEAGVGERQSLGHGGDAAHGDRARPQPPSAEAPYSNQGLPLSAVVFGYCRCSRNRF